MKRMSYSGRFGLLSLVIITLIFPVSAQVSLRTALDFDGDGAADYHMRTPGSTWSIRTNSPSFFMHPFGDPSQEFQAPGDYDGDGVGDIGVFNTFTGTWTWRESSTGAFVTNTNFGEPGDEPVARDYDGDGKTDLAVARRIGSDLTWHLLLNGVEVDLRPDCTFFDTDFVSPGDYDGDGLFDAAVQRPDPGTETSTFQICFAAGGFQSVLFGKDTDLNNPGDYDGDGKTDIAVTDHGFNPGDPLEWKIRRSSDLTQLTIVWGVGDTDTTAQNDYDGDGRTDLAFWRITEGRFHILNAATLSENIVPWGNLVDFPIAAYDTH